MNCIDQFANSLAKHMKSRHFFCVFCITLLLTGSHFICVCVARDTITAKDLLKMGETIVSAGRKFELGFFPPEGNTEGNRYLGIWYFSDFRLPRTYVWVANRDAPIPGSAGSLVLAIDYGDLKIFDEQGRVYFSTNLSSWKGVYRTAKLLDSGNLAFIDDYSGTCLWESFAHPTDTFLPGMFMDDELRLISWLSPDNPAIGNYTFQRDPEDNTQFQVLRRQFLHWKSNQSGGFGDPNEMPEYAPFLLVNFSLDTRYMPSLSGRKVNKTIISELREQQKNKRLLMDSSGEIQIYSWDNQRGSSLLWSEPHACSVYNPCGNFGICRKENGRLSCECLPGFRPDSLDNWNAGEFTNGCARNSAICNRKNKADEFLNLKLMKAGSKFLSFNRENEEHCKAECLSNCQCQAYSYAGRPGRNGSNAEKSCFIWTTDLINLQKDDQFGRNFSIRVAVSDVESTSRDCDSCGESIVPYPLSSGPGCGDPSYQSFFCNESQGQLQFLTSNGSFEVISINRNEHTVIIRANDAGNANDCGKKDRGGRSLMLSQSSPFDVTNWCYNDGSFNNDSLKGEKKIQLRWRAPREPLCNPSASCKLDWPYSDCNMTSDGERRCLCISSYHWDGSALNCTPVVQAQLDKHRKNHMTLIVSITIVAAVVLAGSICFFFLRRILEKRKERKENLLRILDGSAKRDQNLVIEDDSIGDVPFFSLESIVAATDNFSDAKRLGQGGFGPVYKGVFPGGKEIAVKRLSSHSGQGIEEFQNEVRLIAKLQHRNLVRLLGYCIRGSEKLLLYEYMINRSLDTFIFDKGRGMLLDWGKRFEIILGITRGLLYLHQDSRLRIIHRDLKTSNILLDEEFKPKISDFGLARTVGGKETEANTQKIVGTYGYMSPEYALEGLFSIKSDVFSFGVILLEIVSGKRNIGFYKEVLSLLGYAWILWQERKPLEFIDKNLWECGKSSDSGEVLKCINIGLLCVQEDPVDRPTMATVHMMLSSETATLPSPKQPAFISRNRTDSSISGSSSGKPDSNSINKMTLSAFDGR